MSNNIPADEIFRWVWQERGLRQALVELYLFQQGLKNYPCSAEDGRLISWGLARVEGGRFLLTSDGVSLAYNLLEYQGQVEEGSMNRVLERLNLDGNSLVLDAGCGGGQTLFAALKFNPRRVTGIDRDRYGISFADFIFGYHKIPPEKYSFLPYGIEKAPLPKEGFTHIICRGVLHKLPINETLQIFREALKPGGPLYIFVMPIRYYLSRLKLVLRNPIWIFYFVFILGNGLLFSATGRQVSLKVGRRRFSELYFTGMSLKRALRRNGFEIEDLLLEPQKGWRAGFEVFSRKMPDCE